MSAVPRDRQMSSLGSFLRQPEIGPESFRDNVSDELVHEIGQLIQCGDLAAIGPLLARAMLADKSMARAVERFEADEEAQEQADLFASVMEPDDRHYGAMGVRL